MAYEQKPNTGALFKNDRKETENHPDYRGDIDISGRKFWLSAWIKRPKQDGGKTFMSLSVQPKEDKPAKPASTDAAPVQEDDGVPF